jgi:hypothetical protein
LTRRLYAALGRSGIEAANPGGPTAERDCPMEKTLSLADLNEFTGSQLWYRHSLLRHILYTEGARYVAEQGEAYWLLDEIAFAQKARSKVAAEPFQHWVLEVRDNRTARLTCEDGNGNRVFNKAIEYTDFPLSKIAFYFTGNTILLPSEY